MSCKLIADALHRGLEILDTFHVLHTVKWAWLIFKPHEPMVKQCSLHNLDYNDVILSMSHPVPHILPFELHLVQLECPSLPGFQQAWLH